jgi:DNA processing protein
MNDTESLVGFNTVPEFGMLRLRSLLEKFGSVSGILKAGVDDLCSVPRMGRTTSESLLKSARSLCAAKELELANKHGVKVVTFFGEGYPESLKVIPDPPVVLYIKGTLPAENNLMVAIIGARRASYYGVSTAENLAGCLAAKGITVVSGLARGIDTAAHKGALKSNGHTIAVLGSGLSKIYPPENRRLAESISESGAVVSEFPMETAPLRENFPRRNRVISGLSLGVVVVEAANGSGSLITASYAAEQGREVFAVPGRVDSPNSAGTHSLLKDGAKLVENVEDIIDELPPAVRDSLRTVSGNDGESKTCTDSLNEAEKVIFNLLSSEPMHIDEIARSSEFPLSEILNILIHLEIKKVVRQFPGKLFVRA